MDVQHRCIAHKTEIPNLCRIGRAISKEEEMEDDFLNYLIPAERDRQARHENEIPQLRRILGQRTRRRILAQCARRAISEEEMEDDFLNYLIQAHEKEEMDLQHLCIAHKTEIPNLCRIGRAISKEEEMEDDFLNYLIQAHEKGDNYYYNYLILAQEKDVDYYNYLIQAHEKEKMEADFDTYLIKVARNCRNSYRCVFDGGYCPAIFDTEVEMTQHLRSEHSTEIRNFYDYIIGIYEEEVEDDFGKYLIRVARDCTTSYRCPCDKIFHTEDEMVGHLTEEVHKTKMLSTCNLLNGILAAVRRELSEKGMKPEIGNFVTNFVRRIETKYRNLAEQRRGSAPGWWDDYKEKVFIEEASIGRAITEKEMEVDFDTCVTQVARKCGAEYICVYCGENLLVEWDMVYHLGKAHKTEMCNSFSEEQAKEQAKERARFLEEQAKERARFLEEQALLRHVFF